MKAGVKWAFRWKAGVRFFVRAQRNPDKKTISLLLDQISVIYTFYKGGDCPVDLDYAMRIIGNPYLFRENTVEPDTLEGIICRPYERLVFKTRCPPGLSHLLLFVYSSVVIYGARYKRTRFSTRKLTVSCERVGWRRCSYVSVYAASHSDRCRRSID